MLATAGDDGQVKLWDTARPRDPSRISRPRRTGARARVLGRWAPPALSGPGRRHPHLEQPGAAAEGMTRHRLPAGFTLPGVAPTPVTGLAHVTGKRVARKPTAPKLGIGETAQLVVEGRGAVVVGAGRCPRAHALAHLLDPVGDRGRPTRMTRRLQWGMAGQTTCLPPSHACGTRQTGCRAVGTGRDCLRLRRRIVALTSG